MICLTSAPVSQRDWRATQFEVLHDERREHRGLAFGLPQAQFTRRGRESDQPTCICLPSQTLICRLRMLVAVLAPRILFSASGLRRSQRLYRAKVGKRLIVSPKRLNADLGGSCCEMRLDAIANLILSAPCDDRVD